MRNFDGGPSECQGKTNAKDPSRLTQKRAHTVTRQSGERLKEGLSLETRLRHMKQIGVYNDDSRNIQIEMNYNTSYGGNKYMLSFSEKENGDNVFHIRWFRKTKIEGCGLCQSLLSTF